MSFWKFAEIKPFKENVALSYGVLTLAFALLALLLFLYVNVPESRTGTSVFIFLALASGFTIALSELAQGAKINIGFNFNFIGEKPLRALLIGLAFGAILVILNGWQSVIGLQSILTSPTWFVNFASTVLGASVFEELFFRQTLFFIFPFLLGIFLKVPKGFGNITAVFGSSAIWAVYHIFVLGGNLSSIYWIFGIGIVYCIIDFYVLRSLMFSVGAHFANNAISVLVR